MPRNLPKVTVLQSAFKTVWPVPKGVLSALLLQVWPSSHVQNLRITPSPTKSDFGFNKALL